MLLHISFELKILKLLSFNMGTPKYKKYPKESERKGDSESKEMAKAYISKIQKMLKDPKMAEKAAKIIEEMLNSKKK